MKPTLWILGIIGAVALACVQGFVFADDRWMRRTEGAEMKAEAIKVAAATTATLSDIQIQIQYSAYQNAKRAIDNQLFQLEQIPPNQLRPQDRALYQKLLRDRAELVQAWNQRGRPLR